MKFLTYKVDGKEQVGVLGKNEQVVCPIGAVGLPYSCMNEVIEKLTQEEKQKLKLLSESNEGIKLENIQMCAPIPVPKQDIICLGINYMAHAEESARYKKEAFGGERPYAVYFSKRVNEAVADGGIIPSYKKLMGSLDYEVELAVIIGKDAKDVAEEDAFEYIFGYTIINDVSAREIQTRHKQWYFGKSLDGFVPMGPWIVTEECFERPPVLGILSYVNGELRQNATTDLLIFDIPHVIHELSEGMTLKAGTIIAMGTPAGVGMGFEPPRFLKEGDEVCCEIEGIGKITNKIGE
nr:fumarylacetoacetate hydrolase family protein [uncultured Cellulosilyticum sp.]